MRGGPLRSANWRNLSPEQRWERYAADYQPIVDAMALESPDREFDRLVDEGRRLEDEYQRRSRRGQLDIDPADRLRGISYVSGVEDARRLRTMSESDLREGLAGHAQHIREFESNPMEGRLIRAHFFLAEMRRRSRGTALGIPTSLREAARIINEPEVARLIAHSAATDARESAPIREPDHRREPSAGDEVFLPDFGKLRGTVGAVRVGGMGTIYQLRPFDPMAGLVALKTLGEVRDEDQFSREAEAWLAVSGRRNVAEALWYGRWLRMPAILSRWYEQIASHAYVQSLSVDEAVAFLRGLVAGLNAAYEQGLLHRDIKPSNVLVDSNGEARVCDFGIASLRRPPELSLSVDAVDFRVSSQFTVGSIVGTLPYMAPDLLSGAQPTAKTEMYALGVTFFELLTGEHPYAGPETDWRYRPQLRLNAFRSVPRELLTRVQPIVVQLLDLDPSKRPGSYEAVEAALGSASADLGVRASAGMVAQASFLRKENRIDDAITLLKSELDRRGEDPLLLNALGGSYSASGDAAAARQAFARATEWLRDHEWSYESKLYPDPVVNLARIHINSRDYEGAAELLRIVAGLPLLTRAYQYPELGWLYLWEAKPDAAAKHLALCLHMYGFAEADSGVISWAVLAMQVSGSGQAWAADLVRVVAPPVDPLTTLTTLAIASWGTGDLQRDALALIPAHRLAELRSAAPAHGLSLSDLRPPISDQAVQLLLASLDEQTTGGRMIRTLAERIQSAPRATEYPPGAVARASSTNDGPLNLRLVAQGFTAFPDEDVVTYAVIVENPNTNWTACSAELRIRFLNPAGEEIQVETDFLYRLLPGQRAAAAGDVRGAGHTHRLEPVIELMDRYDWKLTNAVRLPSFQFRRLSTEAQDGEVRTTGILMSSLRVDREMINVVAVYRHEGVIVGGANEWVDVPARGQARFEIEMYGDFPAPLTTELYANWGHAPSDESEEPIQPGTVIGAHVGAPRSMPGE